MSVAIWFTNLANCCFRSVTINKVLTDSQTGSTRSEKLLITHLELSLIIMRSYHHRFLYVHVVYDVSPTGFVNGEALRLLRPDSSIKTLEKHHHIKKKNTLWRGLSTFFLIRTHLEVKFQQRTQALLQRNKTKKNETCPS